VKSLFKLALLAVAAKVAYEVVQRQRAPAPLPEGGPYEPAPEPVAEPAGDEVDDLTSVNGIGPAYADRLHRAGISTIADLGQADAEALAEQIDVAPGVVADWQEQARELRS